MEIWICVCIFLVFKSWKQIQVLAECVASSPKKHDCRLYWGGCIWKLCWNDLTVFWRLRHPSLWLETLLWGVIYISTCLHGGNVSCAQNRKSTNSFIIFLLPPHSHMSFLVGLRVFTYTCSTNLRQTSVMFMTCSVSVTFLTSNYHGVKKISLRKAAWSPLSWQEGRRIYLRRKFAFSLENHANRTWITEFKACQGESDKLTSWRRNGKICLMNDQILSLPCRKCSSIFLSCSGYNPGLTILVTRPFWFLTACPTLCKSIQALFNVSNVHSP